MISGITKIPRIFSTQDPQADTSGALGTEWYCGNKYLYYTCGKMYQN